METILITGCAGFIGSNLSDKLLEKNFRVVGLDNFNDYYSPDLKENNLKNSRKYKDFKIYREDVLNFSALKKIFISEKIDKVVHLAARAGVRTSIADPMLYTRVNITGTLNLLRLSTDFKVSKFIFSSSSSVYGDSKKFPLTEDDLCQTIVSPYGASKRAAEFFVESFWRSFGLRSVILRFFTVYGPRGRPDMAPALFVNSILKNKILKQFGDGTSSRDYTFVMDIIKGIANALESDVGFAVINLGNNKPVTLIEFIKLIEDLTGKKARKEKIGRQKGDVYKTWANIKLAKRLLGWQPTTNLREGLLHYLVWQKNN